MARNFWELIDSTTPGQALAFLLVVTAVLGLAALLRWVRL